MIDFDRRTVTLDGKTIRPTKGEFDIIAYLAANPGFVRTRQQIMDAIGLPDVNDRAVDSHIKRIRARGIPIRTSAGVGYYWQG